MCTLVEDYAKDTAKEFAMYMIQQGKDTEEIAAVTHLSEEEVEELRNL